MVNLKIWEDKIKEKRKKTEFRNFVKEITSWSVLNLYKNKWKTCRYPDTWRIKILDNKEAQNTQNYFLDYDFSKDFWKNYENLMEKVPWQYILDFNNNENSEFTDVAFWVKNWYLSFVVWLWVENILYSAFCYLNSANILNSFFVSTNSNNVYFSSWVSNSFNIFYSKYITNSSNLWFCTNMIWSQDCIFCNWLQNKKYCFKNKELWKEEYELIKKQILEKKDKFLDNYKFIIKNDPVNYLSENTDWKYNIKCHNVKNWYWTENAINSRNIILAWWDNVKDFFDWIDAWSNAEDLYWVNWVWNYVKNIYLSSQIDTCSNIYHSYFLKWCSFCIGCIWLKNMSFCIFNKQYTKEEWYDLADKIFTQMDADWILGDFFPWVLNPFYFNDTMAYLIDDSFTKEEVEKDGYMWRDNEIKVDINESLKIIKAHALNSYQWFDSNWKWYIDSEILKVIIKDEKWNYYKIVQMEYDFLVKHWLPIPEIHWLDRIKLWFKF